jgi:MbtH protein
VTNPFDDESGTFRVVVNDAAEHAIWPEFAELPLGWRVAAGPWPRQDCLEHIEQNWAGMSRV